MAKRTQQSTGLWQVDTLLNLFLFSPTLLRLNLQVAWVCKPLLTRGERIVMSRCTGKINGKSIRAAWLGTVSVTEKYLAGGIFGLVK